MKKTFIYFLLVLNAFFISYAYGLNTIKVQVVDHSLPPLKPPAAAAKTTKPAKATSAKSAAGQSKTDTTPGAKGEHGKHSGAHAKKTKPNTEAKKP